MHCRASWYHYSFVDMFHELQASTNVHTQYFPLSWPRLVLYNAISIAKVCLEYYWTTIHEWQQMAVCAANAHIATHNLQQTDKMNYLSLGHLWHTTKGNNEWCSDVHRITVLPHYTPMLWFNILWSQYTEQQYNVNFPFSFCFHWMIRPF